MKKLILICLLFVTSCITKPVKDEYKVPVMTLRCITPQGDKVYEHSDKYGTVFVLVSHSGHSSISSTKFQ